MEREESRMTPWMFGPLKLQLLAEKEWRRRSKEEWVLERGGFKSDVRGLSMKSVFVCMSVAREQTLA